MSTIMIDPEIVILACDRTLSSLSVHYEQTKDLPGFDEARILEERSHLAKMKNLAVFAERRKSGTFAIDHGDYDCICGALSIETLEKEDTE